MTRACEILAERSRRALVFPHMDEPAWLMLVDLYAHQGRNISITSACLASFAPMTTGLRYIGLLEAEGLIAREPDALDGRRKYLRLTPIALERLAEFFDNSARHFTKPNEPAAPRPCGGSCPGARLEAGAGVPVDAPHGKAN